MFNFFIPNFYFKSMISQISETEMKTSISFCSLTIFMMVVLFAVGLSAQSGNELVTPESYFGFKPGSDRMLFTYEDLIAYLKEVDNYSPRLKMVEIGKSPQGRVMYIAFISSAETSLPSFSDR